MTYLLMAYGVEEKFNDLSEADMTALAEKCKAYDAELHATGKVVGGGSLGWESRSLRRNGGKLVVSDGPFVDTKEVVGGFILLKAESFEEAVQVASLHPAARMGEELGWGIELRPLGHCELLRLPNVE